MLSKDSTLPVVAFPLSSSQRPLEAYKTTTRFKVALQFSPAPSTAQRSFAIGSNLVLNNKITKQTGTGQSSDTCVSSFSELSLISVEVTRLALDVAS